MHSLENAFNFEEFHILDCRFKPDINTVLNNDNHKRYHYTDYSIFEKFKEIYFLLSRDGLADNSLTKYSESFPKPKGKHKAILKGSYQAIDNDFLESDLLNYSSTERAFLTFSAIPSAA